MTMPTNFDDNDFLQNWLEKRYGCGVMQEIMDDLTGGAQKQKPQQEKTASMTEGATVTYNTPYCMTNGMAVNDNPYLLDLRKIS